LCSISGIEILFARAEGIEAILQRSGFIRKFGEGRFFNRRAEALRFAWQEIGGESEEVEVSPETL
jgi:hypothetical protein